MKINYILLYILLFLFCSFSFGQNENQYANQIDSIQNLINTNPNDPMEEVRLLNELARLYFYNLQIKKDLSPQKKLSSCLSKLDLKVVKSCIILR